MRRFAVLSLIAMLAGCGSDSSGPDGGSGGSEFDIKISGGTKPTYTWAGGPAFSVSVVRTAAPTTIVWGIANPAMTIGSPVTHGSPSGAAVTANTEPTLTAGVRYRVAITLADTKTGWKEFTP